MFKLFLSFKNITKHMLFCISFVFIPFFASAEYIQVFNATTNGALSWTGNTLGLNGNFSLGIPSAIGQVGALITTDEDSQYGTFPPGTTGDWRHSSSAATLDIPEGSMILHAELVWGSMGRGLSNEIKIPP